VVQIARPHLAIARVDGIVGGGVAPWHRERRDDRARVLLVLRHLDHLGAVKKVWAGGRRGSGEARGIKAPAIAIVEKAALGAFLERGVEGGVGLRARASKGQGRRPAC